MTGTIELVDRGRRIAFSFEDVLDYHGPGSPGGAALAFKVLERALPLLEPDGLCERREILIETAFGGPGARDAFELVTRAVSDDRYRVDPSLARPERGRALERFVFRLGVRERRMTLVLRPGFVTDEFIDLARSERRSVAQERRLDALKLALAARVLAQPAAAVYDADALTFGQPHGGRRRRRAVSQASRRAATLSACRCQRGASWKRSRPSPSPPGRAGAPRWSAACVVAAAAASRSSTEPGTTDGGRAGGRRPRHPARLDPRHARAQSRCAVRSGFPARRASARALESGSGWPSSAARPCPRSRSSKSATTTRSATGITASRSPARAGPARSARSSTV